MQTIPQQLQQKADSGRFCKSWDLDHPFLREVRAAGARPCCKAWVVQRVLSLWAWEETRPWLELLTLLTSQQAAVAASGTSQHIQPGRALWIHPNLEQGCCKALTQPTFLSENVSREREIITHPSSGKFLSPCAGFNLRLLPEGPSTGLCPPCT